MSRWDDDRLAAAYRSMVAGPVPAGLVDETMARIRRAAALSSGRRSNVVGRPGWQPRRRGLALVGSSVAALVMVAVVVSSVLLRSMPGPQPTASESATATATATPSASSAYYEDGIPRTWQGQPVLRGQAALDAAKASTDATPFYVAFWVGYQWENSCPMAQTESDMLFGCGGPSDLGDQPGVESPLSRVLAGYLRVDVQSVAPAPVIARVHTHDTLAAGCPAEQDCEHIMVGDVVWSGGDTTAPHPVTVAQAAAAFGPKAESYAYPIDFCPVSNLPGVPVLWFWPGTASAQTAGTWPAAIVAVFPTTQSLAAAAPQISTDGGVSVVSQRDDICQGADPMYWMARDNILVGVPYDRALGPDKNPVVLETLSDLLKLPSPGTTRTASADR
jgi:hypothetical protein